MVNNSDMLLEEIEVLRNRMHALYLQTQSLKSQNLVKISKQLDQKLNIHQKISHLK